MLSISNLTYRIAGRPILSGCSATLYPNHRIGLVGRNGAGKSTLLRLISGDIAPDAGDIQLPGRWSMGMTTQDAPGGDRSLIDTVLAADKERTALMDELENPDTPPERIGDIHGRLEDISAAAAPSRAARILAGLGFSEEAQNRACSEFSGGWRMRVALAALLFTQPDLLLLDEPTNHLDLEATIWLEAYLKAYRGTILIVSHDRTLLNSVVTDIIHLEAKTLTAYKGNYDFFEKTRAERMALAAKQREKQEAQRAHIMSFVDRFRYKASKATQAQSRLKMLAKMQPIASVAEEWTVTFDFPTPQTLASPLFTIDNGEIGYGEDPAVLKRVNLRIDSDDRIALLGANGNGKSTLLKVLRSELPSELPKVLRSELPWAMRRLGYPHRNARVLSDYQNAVSCELLGRQRPRSWSPLSRIEGRVRRLGEVIKAEAQQRRRGLVPSSEAAGPAEGGGPLAGQANWVATVGGPVWLGHSPQPPGGHKIQNRRYQSTPKDDPKYKFAENR